MPTLSGFSRTITTAIVPGGAIGAHAVPGDIEDGDALIAVTQLTDADPPVPTDLTAEFAISAGENGQVENTTTDTTGDFLVVTWAKAN